MRRHASGLLGGVWLAVLAGGACADAQDDLKMLLANKRGWEAAVESGRKKAAFCFNCHGEEGVAMQPEIPNLAGQPATYLLEQIGKFARGERRDQFMEGLIKALSAEERLHVVAYFSSRPVPTAAATPGGNAQAGRAFYQARCVNCHGERGLGKDLMPTVAGQQDKYLFTSLKRYRDRTGERRNKEMSEATAKLTDQDIQNLVAYQRTLK